MMKKLLLTISVKVVMIILLTCNLSGQSNHPYAFHNPIIMPRIFGHDIISTEEGGEFGAAFSTDGTEIWYTIRDFSKRPVTVIYYSKYENKKWNKPEIASFSGKYEDVDPVFSPDGKVLLFSSKRPVKGSEAKKKFDIWMVKRGDQGWSEPDHLGHIINTEEYTEIYASITVKGNLYFASDRPDGLGKMDIYRAKLVNNVYQTPENLGEPINSQYSDANPYIDPNERFLIFYSRRKGGYGDIDLYISYNDDGHWSEPQNLGGLVNSKGQDFCPSISPDGKYFFFSRAKGKYASIYQMDLDALELKK